MIYTKYDYSKFKKFGISELDFKTDVKRAWTCGNATFRNCNWEVVVSLENYGLSVCCSSERSQIANKNKALDLIYTSLEKELCKYKEIKYLTDATLDECVKELLEYREKGELAYCSFNGYIFYSDTVTLDDAYKKITGKNKAEYEKEIEEVLEHSNKLREEYETQIPELSKFWREEGRKVLEEDKWDEWDSIVPIRLNGLFEDISLEQCLKVIKLLNNGGTFEKAKELIEGQGHSGISFGLLSSLLKQFSSKGEELVNYLNKR